MKKLLLTLSTIVLFLFITTLLASAQTTVTIPCTGTTNPNSGFVTNGGTKTYGFLRFNNNVGGCSSASDCRAAWARFDLAAYVPANATITSAQVVFEVYDKTFTDQPNNRIRVFTGNPGTIAGATLYSTITSTLAANNHGSFGTIPNGTFTLAINANGIGVLQANLAAAINVGFQRTSGNGSYYVYGANGTTAQQPKLVITYTTPCTNPAIATPPANASVCPNGSANFTVAATGTGLTYVWRKGTTPLNNGGNISGATTATLTINPATAGDVASDYNVVVSGDCGSPVTSSNASLSLLNPAPAAPVNFSAAPSVVCLGQNGVTYTIDPVATATSYTWSYSGNGATINGTGNSVTINFSNNATTGTLSVAAVNSCGSSSALTTNITVNGAPNQPGTITGNTNFCGLGNQNYSITTVANTTAYTWAVSGGGSVTGGQGTENAAINWTSGGTYTVSVTADNTCGASTAATLQVNVTETAPAQPDAFTASSATVCEGQVGVAYSIPAVATATSYTWQYSGTGATINGTGNAVSVDFAAGATAGTLSVIANNICGPSIDRAITININTLPDAPSAFTASTATVCQGENGVVYTIPAANGATAYLWDYTGTGATVNGSGNSVTVDFSTTATAGTLRVFTQNACGTNTSPQTVTIAVDLLPATPASFTQSTAVICQAENNVAYAVTTVSGATNYTWSYSGSGVTINDNGNNATLDFDGTATNGTLSVVAENNCGTSTAITLNITVNSSPDAPTGFVTAPATACQGATTVAYEVNAVSGATSYNWTYSGTGVTVTGSGNAVTLNFDNAATDGTLSVTAENSCGTSTAATTNITINTLPDAVTAFTVATATVCQGENGVAYEVTAVNGATNYNWTYSGNGAAINGTGNTVTVDFNNAATTGTLSVAAENSCGAGTAATTAIAVNNLPTAPANLAGDNALCEGATATYTVAAETGITYNWTLPNGWTGASNTNEIEVTANATGGTLSVTAENNCGTSTASDVVIAVNANPAVTLNAFATVCDNDAAFTLTGGSPAGGEYFVDGNLSSTFDPILSGSGNYIVTYTYEDANGCSNAANETITVDICTGIATVTNHGITIYPNPANDYLIVSLPAHMAHGGKITIYDTQGKLIDTVKIDFYLTENSVRINTANYAMGMYRVQVETAALKVNMNMAITK
jgi:large repetitive protein